MGVVRVPMILFLCIATARIPDPALTPHWSPCQVWISLGYPALEQPVKSSADHCHYFPPPPLRVKLLVVIFQGFLRLFLELGVLHHVQIKQCLLHHQGSISEGDANLVVASIHARSVGLKVLNGLLKIWPPIDFELAFSCHRKHSQSQQVGDELCFSRCVANRRRCDLPASVIILFVDI